MFAKGKIKSLQNEKRYNLIFIWSVLLPILLCYTATTIAPMILSFVLTFFNWNLLGRKTFVGFSNWVALFADKGVWNSLVLTIKYALVCMIPSVIIGLMLAMIVNTKKRGSGVFKAVYFLPVVTSWVVISGIWRWLFVADETGIINQLLGYLGISPVFWLGKDMALITLALLGIFKQVGIIMVYFYACV